MLTFSTSHLDLRSSNRTQRDECARRRHAHAAQRRLNLKRNRFMLADATWPLPDLDGAPAELIGEDRHIGRVHLGFFRPRSDGNGRSSFVPPRTPVRCVKAGIITAISETDEGIRIAIDHRNGFFTWYTGLVESPFRATRWCAHLVTRGQLLGCVGGPEAEGPCPLRFQVLRCFEGQEPFPMAIDATYFLARWPRTALEIGTVRSVA